MQYLTTHAASSKRCGVVLTGANHLELKYIATSYWRAQSRSGDFLQSSLSIS